MEKLQLIDILEEDDFLVASPLRNNLEDFRISVVLKKIDEDEDFKLIGTVSSREAENTAQMIEQREHQPFLSQSMESRRASCLRKSLAWDSAFFTSAGVLDPEELFIINKGFEKAESHLLPKIRTDLRKRRSTDIESTLACDDFSIESNQNFEVDLFEDIRASIQRSRIMSSVSKSGGKSGVGEARKQKTHSLKKLDVVSQNRVKSMPACRKKSIYMQGSERVVHPQVVQQAVRTGASNLFSLKPPKSFGSMNPVSAGQTKRVCLGTDHVKMENRTATSGSMSKKSGFGNSCRSSSSATSPNSSSSVSITASNDSTDCFSPFSSASSFTSSSSSRRKTDSRKTRLATTGLTSKTPTRCSLGGKSGSGKPGLPTHLLSMSNHFSYASAASSVDGWSLKPSSTSASTPPGACLGNVSSQALDFQSHSHDQLFDHQEFQQKRLLNQRIEEVTGTGNASAESMRNIRPSGLRMPSPKIGFFDEDKSPVLSVSGGSQLHCGAQGVSPIFSVASNRKRHGEPQPARILPENGNTKPGSKTSPVLSPVFTTVSRYEARNQELDKNSPQVSSTLATLRNFTVKTSKGQRTLSPQFCGEKCSKSRKIGDGGHDARKLGMDSSLKAESKRTERVWKNETSRESKRQVRIRANKNVPIVHKEDANPSKKENGRAKGHHLEKVSRSPHGKEKENLPSFDFHVNDLSRYFEAIDLSRDMVMELNGKKGSSHTNFGQMITVNTGKPIPSKPASLSVSTAVEFLPCTRTPLVDRNSVATEQRHLGL